MTLAPPSFSPPEAELPLHPLEIEGNYKLSQSELMEVYHKLYTNDQRVSTDTPRSDQPGSKSRAIGIMINVDLKDPPRSDQPGSNDPGRSV